MVCDDSYLTDNYSIKRLFTNHNKIIFLDIDGVLQPGRNSDRFNHDLKNLRKTLAEKYQDEGYLTMDEYNLGAVYYDWKPEAIANLKKILNDTDAVIVVSSSWRRFNDVDGLKRLFKIHDLDKYVVDRTPPFNSVNGKRKAIFVYLERCKFEEILITNYIVIDDDRYLFAEHFPDNFVCTELIDFLDNEAADKAIEILNGSTAYKSSDIK